MKKITSLALILMIPMSGCISSEETQNNNTIMPQGNNITIPQGRNPAEGMMHENVNPREPPTELLDACSGKSQGDSCQVTLNDTSIEGTCSLIRDQLMCKPDNLQGPTQ